MDGDWRYFVSSPAQHAPSRHPRTLVHEPTRNDGAGPPKDTFKKLLQAYGKAILIQLLAVVTAITTPVAVIATTHLTDLLITVPSATVATVQGTTVAISLSAFVRTVAYGLILERISRFLFWGVPYPGDQKEKLWMNESTLAKELLDSRGPSKRDQEDGD